MLCVFYFEDIFQLAGKFSQLIFLLWHCICLSQPKKKAAKKKGASKTKKAAAPTGPLATLTCLECGALYLPVTGAASCHLCSLARVEKPVFPSLQPGNLIATMTHRLVRSTNLPDTLIFDRLVHSGRTQRRRRAWGYRHRKWNNQGMGGPYRAGQSPTSRLFHRKGRRPMLEQGLR